MTHARFAATCGLALLTACAAPALPSDDPFASHLVGPCRITRAVEASFSDYVLSADGQLTHLRSVVGGATVDVAHGAGRVDGVGGAMSCVFGAAWSTPAPDLLVIDGACSDGAVRELPLRFGATEAQGARTVRTEDMAWAAPTSWTFQKCDDRPCE